MAHLNPTFTWNMAVSTPELRLVLLALGGRLKREDVRAAMELSNRLTAQRANSTEHYLKENQKLLDNLDCDSDGA